MAAGTRLIENEFLRFRVLLFIILFLFYENHFLKLKCKKIRCDGFVDLFRTRFLLPTTYSPSCLDLAKDCARSAATQGSLLTLASISRAILSEYRIRQNNMARANIVSFAWDFLSERKAHWEVFAPAASRRTCLHVSEGITSFQ